MAGTLASIGNKGDYNLVGKGFALIVSEWNEEVTEALYQGAYATLLQLGAEQDKIVRKNVPGSYELPFGAQRMATSKKIDAIVCLGCIIRGETPHFDYICTAVANGILHVSLACGKPISFGVVTTLDKEQALQRAGGRWGNKGEEAALAVAAMLHFDA